MSLPVLSLSFPIFIVHKLSVIKKKILMIILIQAGWLLSIIIQIYYLCPSSTQFTIWAVSCDFQQCGILSSVDSDEPVWSPLKLRNSKWCSVSSSTVIEYSSDKQRLWSDCAYAQADLRLCWSRGWSHIPRCWKAHALAHLILIDH